MTLTLLHSLSLTLADASGAGTGTELGTPDYSVYYYSYSTIAQALAGAFGFLAAIVLYRLQALNGHMERIATNLMGDPRTFQIEPFRTLFAYQRWAMFVDHVNRDQDGSNRSPVFKNLNFLDIGAMNHANNQILSIRFWFIVSIVITVFCISVCLISLFLMAWFHSMLLLAAMLVMGLICLSIYARLMMIVLQ